MQTVEIDRVTELTPKGIKSLLESKLNQIICQIFDLDISKIPNRYNGQISDGYTKYRCVFAENAATYIKTESIKKYAIIKLIGAIVKPVSNQTILIITEILLINNNVQEEIGYPIAYKDYAEQDYNNVLGSNQIQEKYLKAIKVSSSNQNSNQINKKDITTPTNSNKPTERASSVSMTNKEQKNIAKSPEKMIIEQPAIPQKKPFSQTNQVFSHDLQAKSTKTESVSNSVKKSPITFLNKNQNLISNTNKLSQSQEDDYMLIRQLVPSHFFIIKARIIKKSEIRKYTKNNQEGQVFSIDLLDEEKNQIQGSFFKDAVYKWYPILEEGKIYRISGGQVKMATQKITGATSDYQIFFESSSIFNEVTGDDLSIPYYKFSIIKIKDIQNKETGSFVDVVGFIQKISDLQDVQLKTGESKPRRTLYIYDDSLQAIETTLWGDKAINFQGAKDDIILIKNARIGCYNSIKNIAFVSQTQIFKDNIPKNDNFVNDLLNWKKSNNITDSDIAMANGASETHKKTYVLLAQIENETENMSQDKLFFYVKANVAHIKTEGMLYYLSCSNVAKCQRKVVEDNEEWRCESCNISIKEPIVRYTLSVNLTDSSGSLWISCFDKIAENLVGKSAKELKQLKDSGSDTDVVEALREVTNQEYEFKIMSKIENYNSDKRIKHQALAIKKINYAEESKEMLKTLALYEQYNPKQNPIDFQSNSFDIHKWS